MNNSEVLMLFVLGLSTQVWLFPYQMTQQGRLIDSNGAAVDGQHVISFRIYDSVINGNLLWEEPIVTLFNNGYYSTMLGTDVLSNPLDDSIFKNPSLFLEVDLLTTMGLLKPTTTYRLITVFDLSKTAENPRGAGKCL